MRLHPSPRLLAPLALLAVVVSLALLGVLVADAAPQGGQRASVCKSCDPPAPLEPPCNEPGTVESYGIQDFPCTAESVEYWVDNRQGIRQRHHAWYLFAGVNRPDAEGEALWRRWPTATQTFGQARPSSGGVGSDRLAVLEPLPGAILERPAPGTPRIVGPEDSVAPLAAGGTARVPGVEPADLALAGAPGYDTPEEVLENPAYEQCVSRGTLLNGPTLQNEGNVMIAGVVFSPNARRWILDNELWKAGKLDSLMPEAPGDPPTEIEPLPSDSLVLKPMLWPVPHDGYVPLPLWDDLPPTQDMDAASGCERYAGFERQELWNRAVALSAGAGDGEVTHRDVTYLVDGNVSRPTSLYPATDRLRACDTKTSSTAPLTYVSAEVVPLERFYTIRYGEEEFARLHPCDRALLDQSAHWSYGRAFDRRDALVLVGMHIMTKEQPIWTFQSAWWDDLPEDCFRSTETKKVDDNCPLFAGQRPVEVEGADTWRNYKITTAYGVPQQPSPEHMARYPPDVKAVEGDKSWPVMYNPYIELAAAHPIETNCMNCHVRAAWPGRVEKREPHGAYLVEGEDAPNLIAKFDPHDEKIFDGLLLTDSLWVISDRACSPPECTEPQPWKPEGSDYVATTTGPQDRPGGGSE